MSFLIPVDLAFKEENLVQLPYIRDKEMKKIRFFIKLFLGITSFHIGKQQKYLFFSQYLYCILKLPHGLDSNGYSELGCHWERKNRF